MTKVEGSRKGTNLQLLSCRGILVAMSQLPYLTLPEPFELPTPIVELKPYYSSPRAESRDMPARLDVMIDPSQPPTDYVLISEGDLTRKARLDFAFRPAPNPVDVKYEIVQRTGSRKQWLFEKMTALIDGVLAEYVQQNPGKVDAVKKAREHMHPSTEWQ